MSELRWGDLVVAGDARRRKVRERHGNGLDAVEVREGGRRLVIYFLEHAPHRIAPGNLRVEAPLGGREVRVTDVRRAGEADPELEDRLIAELDRPGSGGRYRLRIVERRADGTPGRRPLRGIDPRFAEAEFVFDVDAPQPPIVGAPAGAPASGDAVSYLARDYAGLRQLMLDRLAVTLPAWTETHEPDIWITLVELLAYVGDDLSYYEDAVATEAYLATARNRISIRRHGRLVNYRLHEGCNARTWVCVDVNAAVSLPLDRVSFATAGAYVANTAPVIEAATVSGDVLATFQQYTPLAAAPGGSAPAEKARLRPAHNMIGLWSWGETDSHLASGATAAVFQDGKPGTDESDPGRRELELHAGDVIVLEETADPATGGLGPANPSHRQAVRLTSVRRLVDDLYRQPLLEVRWAPEDALRFELAVRADDNPCCQASGNVVLVAHGIPDGDEVTLGDAKLSRAGIGFSTPFPDPRVVGRHQARELRHLYEAWRREVTDWMWDAVWGTPLDEHQLETLTRQVGQDELNRFDLIAATLTDDPAVRAEFQADALAELLARADRLLAGRRRRLEALARLAEASGPLADPLLAELQEDWGAELTAPLDRGKSGASGPAAEALVQDPRRALPVLELVDAEGIAWAPVLDLIGSAPNDSQFVAEIDDQGVAQLRFNNAPSAARFTASYWVGNGAAGNAEIDAVNAIVWPADGGAPPSQVTSVRNPLPITSGIDAESTADAKRAIPGAFLDDQRRALTTDDYAAIAQAVTGVRRAVAQIRFTGSVTVVDVAVAPALGEDPSSELLWSVQRTLDAVRKIGHTVRVRPPRYRPLLVTLDVTLSASAVRADTADALARLLSSGWLADGTPALFNPSKLEFAQTLYPSPIIAAVHAVAGVESVTLASFGFLDEPAPAVAAQVAARLQLGASEIARLDNDPTRPQHGYALLYLEGGR
ncbi:MAG: putative baseplate assembly protein [Solirubrobacteraceae bacterium]